MTVSPAAPSGWGNDVVHPGPASSPGRSSADWYLSTGSVRSHTLSASFEKGFAFTYAANHGIVTFEYALDVSHVPRSPNHETKSPSCPASAIADRAFIDIVATRDLRVARMTSASAGAIISFAVSPAPTDVP